MNDQREFETFIADSGCFSTRPKTPEGCARLRAWNDAMATASEAWLIVTSVNTDRGEVEARLAF